MLINDCHITGTVIYEVLYYIQMWNGTVKNSLSISITVLSIHYNIYYYLFIIIIIETLQYIETQSLRREKKTNVQLKAQP